MLDVCLWWKWLKKQIQRVFAFLLSEKSKENGFIYEKLRILYKKSFGDGIKQGDNVQLHF